MEKNLTNKVIQSEEFNVKENRCYNVLVLINHHQDLEKMLTSVVWSSVNVKWNTKKGGDYIYRESGG